MMESENNKEFDRLIKAKLSNLKAEVPASLWTTIAKELPPQEKVRKIAPRFPFPYRWAVVAACLLIAFTFWKVQPEEVVHLRSTAAVAEEPAVFTPPKEEGPAAPQAPADRNISQSFVTVKSESKVPNRRQAAPEDLSREVRSSYAAVEPLEPAHILPAERTSLSEPDENLEPEIVYPPLEEDIAFAPGSDQEAPADLPGTTAPAAEERARPKVVSSVLNFIAGNIQIGDSGPRIEFYEDEHGVLKVDLKGFLSKNNQGL